MVKHSGSRDSWLVSLLLKEHTHTHTQNQRESEIDGEGERKTMKKGHPIELCLR